jgi:hypothetical protein
MIFKLHFYEVKNETRLKKMEEKRPNEMEVAEKEN